MGNAELRSPVSECKVADIVAPSGGYAKGDLVKTSTGLIGIILKTAVEGATTTIAFEVPKAIVEIASAATGAFVLGTKGYFVSGGTVSASSGGNTLCCNCLEPSEPGDTTLLVTLQGHSSAP